MNCFMMVWIFALHFVQLETIQTAIPRIPCGLFDQPCSTRILCRLYNLLFIGSVTQSPTSSVSCVRRNSHPMSCQNVVYTFPSLLFFVWSFYSAGTPEENFERLVGNLLLQVTSLFVL